MSALQSKVIALAFLLDRNRPLPMSKLLRYISHECAGFCDCLCIYRRGGSLLCFVSDASRFRIRNHWLGPCYHGFGHLAFAIFDPCLVKTREKGLTMRCS